MTGIIVITHGKLCKELLEAVESIIGEQQNISSIEVSSEASIEVLSTQVETTLKNLSKCENILVFTDMLGGTPCNIVLPFVKSHNIEIISGVNLYMVITECLYRDKISLKELIKKIIESGRNSIVDVKCQLNL